MRNLAARTGIMLNKEEQINSYITAGLVAMWDGEQNAGLNQHNNNATTWIDLVGNSNLTGASNGGSFAWGSNYVSLNNYCFVTYFTPALIAAINGDKYTIELVCKDLDTSNKVYMFNSANASNPTLERRPIRIYHDNNTGLFRYIVRQTTYVTHEDITYIQKQPFNLSLQKDGYQINTNYNGTYFSSYSYSSFKRDGLADNTILLGVNGVPYYYNGKLWHNNGSKNNLIVYCIRIYNRKLSSEEIQMNFSVDNDRFKFV